MRDLSTVGMNTARGAEVFGRKPAPIFLCSPQSPHGKDYVSLNILVGFEVFTAVTMKNAVFWGVAPCRCGRLN
jgi:hypothetical protein